MKTRSLAAAASIGFMFLLMLGINAEAAELKVLSAIGMQSVLEGLGPKFERATGHKLAISFATAGAAIKRAQGGEAVDVISSPDALKRTLLAAKSISYVEPASGGASGVHFAKVLDRLGIANEMKSKTIFPNPKTPAEVGVLVANGEAEIGVHVIVELVSVAGIDIVGPLPGDLQNIIVFAAAVMASAKDAEAAKALVTFLRTPEAVAVIRTKGMEPSTP
ncbi:MAG: ABC transporter substrate-binding protein [Betaproteobacteria bacterium]|nr:MAG: ABC transporter substrate-binding protein [Betaproteobacteria bacterium]